MCSVSPSSLDTEIRTCNIETNTINSLNKTYMHTLHTLILHVPGASLSTLGRNYFLVIGRDGLSSHRLSLINICNLLQRKANT